MQRYVVNLTIQAKRCKFHLPFLLRAANDSSFIFSRDACLTTARAVIQLQKCLAEEDETLWINSSRLCGILHLFFYATMVLVMDFCVHRDAGCELGRKAEIQDVSISMGERITRTVPPRLLASDGQSSGPKPCSTGKRQPFISSPDV